jgi:hypothetical protein
MEPGDETIISGHGMYALEVPRGWFDQNNVERGHKVDLGISKQASQDTISSSSMPAAVCSLAAMIKKHRA